MSEVFLEEQPIHVEKYFQRKLKRKSIQALTNPNRQYGSAMTAEQVYPEIESWEEPVIESTPEIKGWSVFDKIWIISCAVIAMAIFVSALLIRMNTIELEQSISQIELRINDYLESSNRIQLQMLSQYDYDTISQAADSHGMTIEKDRVRTVNNEN